MGTGIKITRFAQKKVQRIEKLTEKGFKLIFEEETVLVSFCKCDILDPVFHKESFLWGAIFVNFKFL